MGKGINYTIPSINTTSKNRYPEGTNYYLSVLNEYRGMILTKELARSIFYRICSDHMYKASVLDEFKHMASPIPIDIVEERMDAFFTGTSQTPHGRFMTLFIGHKKLGFCSIEIDKPIIIRKNGLRLLKFYDIYNSPYSTEEEKIEALKEMKIVYRNALVYLVHEPLIFERPDIYNNKVIVPFLFGVLKELGSIGRRDSIIVSMWPNNNVKACCETILQLRRNKDLYTEKNCVNYMLNIIGVEHQVFFNKKNTEEKKTISDIYDAFQNNWCHFLEFAEFIELTSEKRITLNLNEMDCIDMIISEYSDLCSKFRTKEEYEKSLDYFNPKFNAKPVSMRTDLDRFYSQSEKWTFEEAIEELKKLNKGKKYERNSKIPSNIDDASLLEFLSSICLHKVLKSDIVKPNFFCDNNGMILPKGHAGAKKADIIVENYQKDMLVEVTLLRDKYSIMDKEYGSVMRHLELYNAKNSRSAFTLFIAPEIPTNFISSIGGYNKNESNINNMVIPISLSDFIKLMKKLYGKGYNSSDIYLELHQKFLY